MSPYQKQYKFSAWPRLIPRIGRIAWPNLATNGVCCYEQDWLGRICFNSDLGRAVGLGDAFTDGMAAASAKHGLMMQYAWRCRAISYKARVLQPRPSAPVESDLSQGSGVHFLYASQLAAALGMWPWCDVFQNSETGNMVVAVLSARRGWLCGATMGKEALENIRLAARADGVLVKPGPADGSRR